ncbi:MFS transporter permease [Rhodococcus sp. SC4]|nr:MFS transporter permease [Rhodococcus sp. SC4]
MSLQNPQTRAEEGGLAADLELDSPRVRRRGWIITLMLMAFMLINFADKVVVSLAGVEIKTDLGLSNQQFGTAQSAFFWLFAVGAVALGSLGGRISARWLLAGLVGLWVLSLAPMTTTVGFGVFLACRMLLGFAEGPAGALSQQIAHTWFSPKRRSLPASVVIMGASLGPLIAAPVLTWIIQSYSWHAAFFVLMAAGVMWLVAWLFIGGEGPAGNAGAGTGNQAVTLPDTVPVRLLWTRPTVIGVAIFSFCSYWATALKVSWLPLYLREGLHYSANATGLLITLPFAAAVILTFLAGLISTRLSLAGRSSRTARALFAAGLLAAGGVCMIGFTVLPVGPTQMVLIALAFSLNTAAWGLAFSLLSDVVPAKQRGSVMSITVAIYSLGGVAAPLLIGSLVSGAADTAAGYGRGFVIVGVIMLVGALAAAVLVNPERDATTIAAHHPNK